MFQKIWIFITVLTLVLLQANCWTFYTDIRTGRVDLFSTNTSAGSVLSSTSVPPSYNISYTSAISQTTSSGIGIVGFQTYVTNQFSINVTINNFLTTSMRITTNILDDTVVTFLTINYIAVGAKTYFLEVQFYCFLPTILSTGNGSRTETRTSTTLFANKVLLCNVYLSGFRVHNSEGVNNYLSSSVTCPSGSSNLNYAFTTSENNTISQICYTTIIFCDVCTKSSALYYEWGQSGDNSLSFSIKPSATNLNSILARYKDFDQTFWGISTFNLSRGFTRGFSFQTNYFNISGANVDINYYNFTNTGTYLIVLSHFFIATRNCNLTRNQWFNVQTQDCVDANNCIASNLTFTLNGTAQFCSSCDITCLTCNGSLSTNCSSCNNVTFRTLQGTSCPCVSGYIDIGTSSCYPCSNFITGCTTCTSTSICNSCSSGFSLNMLGICQCTTGFLVTGVCTSLVGCVSATNLQGTVYCLACNSTLNYVRSSNFTCTCKTGYVMNTVQDCISICGDSIIVSGEGCDDGNNVNGDGCNSTCQVQANFYCDNSNPPSVCYIIANITATVKYVQRVLTANQATFAIQLLPFYDDFLFMDFGGFISTDLPCTQKTVNYINNLLIVNCWYPYTIEGNNYTLNLTLDTKFFTNGSKVSVTLPASGMNAKLTSDGNYNMYYPLNIMVIVLDAIAIIVFLLTCITERMIGVQMIQTLQSVLYSMALMKTCPSTFASLQSLRYTNGYNEPAGVDPARRYPYTFSIGQVGLDQEFLLDYNISYIFLGSIIVLMLVLKLIMMKFQRDKAIEEQEFNRKFEMKQVHKSYYKILKLYNFLFERVFFLLCFMNMFLIIFSLAVQLSNLRPDYLMITPQFNLLMCGIAICILVTFLAMVIINGVYPSIKIFPMFMNPKYPVYYVIYNSAFIILISFLYGQKWLFYVLLAMVVCNLIYTLVYVPYHEGIHNITLTFNQATIILALGAYFYQQMTNKTDNNEGIFTILIFIIIAMLYICVALSVYRLYRFYQFMKLHKLSYNQSSEKSKGEDKELISLKEQENQVIIKQKQKQEIDKSSKALKNFENDYYENVKMNKNPLNISRDYNDNAETKRDKPNNLPKPKSTKDNQQNYDTFNKNPAINNSFQISKIDPNPVQISLNESPYNQYGQLKKQNSNDEGEHDALKVIKARLKKDFYQKVRGTQYKQPSKVDLLDKSKDKPANFLPDDYHDIE